MIVHSGFQNGHILTSQLIFSATPLPLEDVFFHYADDHLVVVTCIFSKDFSAIHRKIGGRFFVRTLKKDSIAKD